jgi:hypothetical protein
MGSYNYNAQWRIALGLGALPMTFAFIPRWKMSENPSWKERNISSVSNITSSFFLLYLQSSDDKTPCPISV